MSIRHQEDLKKIRPVLSFMIEYHPNIYAKNLKPLLSLNTNDFVADSKLSEKATALGLPVVPHYANTFSPPTHQHFDKNLMDYELAKLDSNRSVSLKQKQMESKNKTNHLAIPPPILIEDKSSLDAESSGENVKMSMWHYTSTLSTMQWLSTLA
jgi:hypothetical protein